MKLSEELTIEQVVAYAQWFFSADGQPPPGVELDAPSAASRLFGHLFLKAPSCEIDPLKTSAFDELSKSINGGELDLEYALPYPKWEFLNYLSQQGKFLFHGSNRTESDRLLPSPQQDWQMRPVEVVFASSDPIWPLFFATMDWGQLSGSVRNGGFMVEKHSGEFERFYFFSADTKQERNDILRDGVIHLVSREGFSTNPSPVRFDEWHHGGAVPVLARLSVEPRDFPFGNAITRHTSEESVHRTWLQYKARLSAL